MYSRMITHTKPTRREEKKKEESEVKFSFVRSFFNPTNETKCELIILNYSYKREWGISLDVKERRQTFDNYIH